MRTTPLFTLTSEVAMHKISKKILGVTFCLLIATMTFACYRPLRDFFRYDYPKYANLSASERFTHSVKALRDRYVQQVKWKDTFIEINGGFNRLIGKQECNQVVRLNNGMMARIDSNLTPDQNLPNTIKQITGLSERLKQMEIPFLYVNCPDKMDPDGTLLPRGITFYSNPDSDLLLAALKENQIAALDLRPIITPTGEDLKRHFFRTDHHWNAFGAFKATQMLVRKTADILAFDATHLLQLELANWEVITRKNWWLGSEGQRTGSLFSGLDDFDILIPKFDTCISLAVPTHNEFYKGAFKDSVIQQRYINKRIRKYKETAYLTFGFDRALRHYRNEFAPITKHILVVQDSFGDPVDGYLSTIFAKVDVVDLRHYKETTLLTLLERAHPDIVVMLFNPSTRSDMATKFGCLELTAWQGEETVLANTTIEVFSDNNDNNQFKALPTPLKNGQTYTLEIENVEVLDGTTQGFSLALYCPETKTTAISPLFDLTFTNHHGGAHWEFNVPEQGDWNILFYAGVANKTQGNSLRYRNVTLKQRLR